MKGNKNMKKDYYVKADSRAEAYRKACRMKDSEEERNSVDTESIWFDKGNETTKVNFWYYDKDGVWRYYHSDRIIADNEGEVIEMAMHELERKNRNVRFSDDEYDRVIGYILDKFNYDTYIRLKDNDELSPRDLDEHYYDYPASVTNKIEESILWNDYGVNDIKEADRKLSDDDFADLEIKLMDIDTMKPETILRKYLEWEGIIGYDDEIIEHYHEGDLSDYLADEGIIGYDNDIEAILGAKKK